MDMEFGKAHQANHTSASGWTAKLRDMAFMCGKITISMKENGTRISDTVTAVIFFIMEMCMSVSTFTGNQKVSDSTNGKTDQLILALS